jgi:hypothetical protein
MFFQCWIAVTEELFKYFIYITVWSFKHVFFYLSIELHNEKVSNNRYILNVVIFFFFFIIKRFLFNLLQ